MKLKITQKRLEEELEGSRRKVEVSGLPRVLAGIDAGAFGTTPLNLEMLEAVAAAHACASAAAEKDGALGGSLLAFLFAEEAADRLAALGDAPSPPDGAGLPEGDYEDFPRAAARAVPDKVLADAARFLKFYAGHADSAKRLTRDDEALRCLHSYFRLLARTLRKVGPEDAKLDAETPRLRLRGWSASGTASEEPSGLLPVRLEDIVGNAAYVERARRLARDVAGFDLERGENPKKVRNPVLFVLGSPGCGKTVTAHAVGNEFLELCAKAGLPARFRVIRRTDWASSYQNQSANRLLEIFREEVFGFDGVCGVYWPDIDTAFSSRSEQGIRQEEKNILGTLFGILDGTVGPKNGKWFLICDANTLHMDEATLSRLSQSPLRALGPENAADYLRLLRDIKLRGMHAHLPLSDEEWNAVAGRIVAERLSGRAVDSLAGRILTAIEDFDEPEGYFTLPFEEKKKLLAELARPVRGARILEMIDEYCRFEREAERRADEERFKERVEQIRFHLSAQRAALGDGA